MIGKSLMISFVGLALATPLWGQNFASDWPVGKTQRMEYALTAFYPNYGTSHNTVEITRIGNDTAFLAVRQIIDMADQKVRIVSEEQYDVSGKLRHSLNTFYLPPEIAESLGRDTILITAWPEGDFLVIQSPKSPDSLIRIPGGADLVTGIGAILRARNAVFSLNEKREYRQVNLIMLSEENFEAVTVSDSVVAEETVSTTIGEFECLKVLKDLPDQYAYTYYSKNDRNLPVMIEGFDKKSLQRTMNITLVVYQP